MKFYTNSTQNTFSIADYMTICTKISWCTQ